MSDPIVTPARAANGRAVHFFVVDGPLEPICGRLKGAVDSIAETDDDVTCKACDVAFRKGNFQLSNVPAVVPPVEDETDEDEAQELEGADESDDDSDEEHEASTGKAQKFAAFARSYGWSIRVKVQNGAYDKTPMTFVFAEHGDVRIWMAWQEGRYQYDESRIIKGEGEVLNAMIRNASAARGYVNAINIAEDATRPVLIRKQGGKAAKVS